MKMNNIGKNIRKACNWAFNNNGVEVDPNRIRLCDGSPIHSVGTTRLRSKWPYALAIMAPIATNYALDEEADIIDFASSSIAIVFLYKFRKDDKDFYNKIGLNTETFCINKNPSESTPKTSPKHMRFAKDYSSLNTKLSLIATPFTLINYPSLANVADMARVSYTYGKVAKGDWVIEEMPKTKEPRVPEPDMM